MAQHFLMTRKAKSLNLAIVFRMTDAQAEAEVAAAIARGRSAELPSP